MFDLRDIQTKSTNFSFLLEIDFPAFKKQIDNKDFARPASIETAIENLRLTLMSSNANSIWVHGEEGVGKTTYVAALLQKVAKNEIGPSLASNRYFIFSSHAFFKLEQSKQFSQFDECMDFLNQETSILIFDRFDDFVSTTNGDSKYYVNALVDALVNMQAIIITQTKNNDLISRASTGLGQKFVEYVVKSPTKDGLLLILRSNKYKLEKAHDVIIPEETLKEVCRILERYPGRAFVAPWPQGPLELLDRTAAHVRVSAYNLPTDYMQSAEKLAQLEDEKASLEASPFPLTKRIEEINKEIIVLKDKVQKAKEAWDKDFKPFIDSNAEIEELTQAIEVLRRKDKTAAIVAEIESKKTQRQKLIEERKNAANNIHAKKAIVTRADVQHVFAAASGINLSDVSGDEREKLLNAETELGKYVFGQNPALRVVANALRAARSGIADPNRPPGVIMLTGPTGTGKTELGNRLAILDGGEGAKPVIFRMNKYKDQSAVSEFRGPAPGLVGYSEDGPKELRRVRKNGRCISMFDEIEKAHEELFDVIMSITDEGQIEDSASNPIIFKDTIVIFTTNVILPEDLKEHFDDEESQLAYVKQVVIDKINPKTGRPYFKPEFIERIDAIVMFDYLTSESAKSIMLKNINDQNKTLEAKNYKLVIGQEDLDRLIAKIFKNKSNGRTVRQAYNRMIRPVLTNFLLKDKKPPGENSDIKLINIKYIEDNITIE